MKRQGDGGRIFLPLSRRQAIGRAPRPGSLAVVAVALLGALLALSACGEEPPARLGAIPVPPSGSTEIPEDVLPFDRAAVAGSIQSMAGAGTVEVRVYLVSAGTTFQALESHYQGFLDAGWQAQETPALAAAREQGQAPVLWSNEGTGEILSLQYTQAPAYGGNLLIVLHATKEHAQTSGRGTTLPA